MDEREPDHGRDLWEAIDAYAEARIAYAEARGGEKRAWAAGRIAEAEDEIFGISGFPRPGNGEGDDDG